MLRRRMGPDEFGQNLETLAEYLGGGVVGENTITFPGPGHSERDRSASVTFTETAWNGRFKVFSFANESERPLIEFTVWNALKAMGWHGDGAPVTDLQAFASDKRAQGMGRAAWMWGFGRPIRGTPVETYLASRALDCPDTDALAYWAHGRFGRSTAQPLMLAAVRDIVTDELVAVHRTALTLDGHKAYVDLNGNPDCRAFTGSPKGGAIKIHPAGARLGVGEGIETSLSLREIKGFEDLSIWSLGSAAGLARLAPLDGVAELIVAEDNDQDGVTAATEVAHRWQRAGRAVRVIGPRRFPNFERLNDLNDFVMEQRYGRKTQGRGIE